MDHAEVTTRFEKARDAGEAALALLWAELSAELGSAEASSLWWRLWSGSDASQT